MLKDLDSGRVFSYAELNRHINALRAEFVRLGLRRGDSVATNLDNSPELAILILASLMSGIRLALIEPQTPETQLKFYCSLVEPKAAFFKSDETAAAALAGLALSSVRALSEEAAYADAASAPDTAVGDEAFVIFSSGTTGSPKGIVHTHENVAAELDSMNKGYAVGPGMQHYLQLTLAHVSGLYRGLLMPICSGGTISLRRGFEPRIFWQDIQNEGIEFVQLVPSHVAMLNRAPDGPSGKLPLRLKFVGTASAYLPPKEQRSFEERFKIPVLQGYGLTECTCGIVLNSLDPAIRRPGVAGLPLDVNEIKIFDSDGIEVDQGEVGELWVRGKNVARRFLGSEGPQFSGDWFKTGDMGRIEKDGNIVLLGRRANVVSRGAYKIYALEVEEAMSSLPNIREAAVIGVPHPVLGQDLVGFVSADRPVDPQELIGALRHKISSFKIPTQIISVEAMPHNHLGKVRKDALLADYEKRLAEHPSAGEAKVLSRLRELVANIFALDPAAISANSSHETIPQWDSLGHLQVLAGIEQTFWVKISDDAAVKAQTLGDWAKVIDHAIRSRS